MVVMRVWTILSLWSLNKDIIGNGKVQIQGIDEGA